MATREITGTFATRREAEMAVETLVQEYGLDRAQVQVRAEGESNTSGTVVSGADAAEPTHHGDEPDHIMPEPAADATAEGVRAGGIVVSAQIDEALLERATAAFRDYGATLPGGR